MNWPAGVVSGLSNRVSQEADSVATEVLKKVDRDIDFGARLLVGFWNASLYAAHEELVDFGIMHAFDNFAVHLREHEVSLLVLERVMESVLGAGLETLNEGINLVHLCVW